MSTYACADLHGCYNLYNSINSFLKLEDQVIFLGDACDRGPQSWETVCAILDNPQWTYLMGNHEQMLLEPLHLWQKKHKIHHNFLSFKNGGLETFNQAIQDPDLDKRIEQLEVIERRSTLYTYNNADGFYIFCCHAGFTPWFNHNYTNVNIPRIDSLLWDRTHVYEEWNESEMPSSAIMVHGHTPIPYIRHMLRSKQRLEPGALWYCDDHKVCLDTGCWATNYTVLLDLDTFEEHIIKGV